MSYQHRSRNLEHAGVKGMRWGVRRDRTTLFGGDKKQHRPPDASADELSMTQLKAQIERMRLLKDYRTLRAELTRKPPSRAQQFIERAVVEGTISGGKRVIENTTARLGGEIVQYLLGEVKTGGSAKKEPSKTKTTDHAESSVTTNKNDQKMVSKAAADPPHKPTSTTRPTSARASRAVVRARRLNRRRFGR